MTAAPGFLDYQYGDLILEPLLDNYSRESVQAYWRAHFIEFKKNKFKLLREALIPFVDPKKCLRLPSPRWVFSHGLCAFSNEIDSAAYPKHKWNEIRRKAAQKNLGIILEDEIKLRRNPQRYMSDVFQNID